MLGNRHYEVARFLKSIPLNEIFTITLIEPVAAIGNNVRKFSSKKIFSKQNSYKLYIYIDIYGIKLKSFELILCFFFFVQCRITNH